MKREGSPALVATLLSGMFLAVLNQMLTTSALPAIMADLSIDATLAQWLTSGYTLVYASVIPMAAYLLGRFEVKQLFLGAYSFLLAGSVIAALAPNFVFLLAGRLLQAICVGVLTPVVMTVVMLAFPTDKRGFAMGLANLVIGVAPALGPLYAGALCDAIGWRAMFASMALASVAVMAVAFFLLPDAGQHTKDARLDIPSVAMSAAGLAGLLYGVGSFSTNPELALALAVAGIAVLALFVRRQLKQASPLLDVRVLSVREFRLGALVVMLMQGLFMAATSVVPLLIQSGLDGTATLSGLVVMPGALLGALLSLVAGKLYDSFGVRLPAILGAAFMAAGLAGLAVAGHAGLGWISLFMVGVSCGSVLAFTPLLTWGANAVGEQQLAHANAISNTLRQASSAIGTALFVSLMAVGASASQMSGSAAQVQGAGFSFAIAFALSLAMLVAMVVKLRPSGADASGK